MEEYYVMKRLFDKLQKTGILIGSRRWGGSTEESDYDLVFGIKTTNNLIKYFKENGLEFKYLGNSASDSADRHTMFNEHNLKIQLGNETVNILSYEESEIYKIVEMNEYMDNIANLPIGIMARKDKNVRIHIIESYLNFAFDNVNNVVLTKRVPEIRSDLDDLI